MKLKLLAVWLGVMLMSLAPSLHAEDLMDVYSQALSSDPTFKKAEADWQSAKESLPIARAGYLPQLDLAADWVHQYAELNPEPVPSVNGTNTNYTITLTLTQPIFNFATWKAIKSAKASVKAATATYAAAQQNLMLRTVAGYLDVMQAYDQLRYTLARKKAVLQQLKQAQEQFKVGLIAITGVYNAKSEYDRALADAISDQNRLNDATEKLREITGRHYRYLNGIGPQIPLSHPQPNDINAWTRTAEAQNYTLRAQDYTVIAARETIKQQAAGWMPQVDFIGEYEKDKDSAVGDIPETGTQGTTAGIQVNFPLIQGGLVTAQTHQAEFNYLSASSQLQFVHRQVVSETRQAFLGVMTGVYQVRADLQSVISAKNAFEATQVGYEVGTRTMLDVLDDLTSLYREQQRYADDQYQYILDTIELKANAGTLSVRDLQIVNTWLKAHRNLKVPKAAFGPVLKTPLSNGDPAPTDIKDAIPRIRRLRDRLLQSKVKTLKSTHHAKKHAKVKKSTFAHVVKQSKVRKRVKKHVVVKRSHQKIAQRKQHKNAVKKAVRTRHMTKQKAVTRLTLPLPKNTEKNTTHGIPVPKATQAVASDEPVIPLNATHDKRLHLPIPA